MRHASALRRSGTNVIAPWDLPEYQDDLNQLFPRADQRIPGDSTDHVRGRSPEPRHSATPYSGRSSSGRRCGVRSQPRQSKDSDVHLRGHVELDQALMLSGSAATAAQQQRTQGRADVLWNPDIATPLLATYRTRQPGTRVRGIANTNPAHVRPAINGRGGNEQQRDECTNPDELPGRFAQQHDDAVLSDSPDQVDFATHRSNKTVVGLSRIESSSTTLFKQNEFSALAKDDWKVTRNLTITPGVRWDYYGVPYLGYGMTVGARWWRARGLRCFRPGLHRLDESGNVGDVTSFEFVGPKLPEPGQESSIRTTTTISVLPSRLPGSFRGLVKAGRRFAAATRSHSRVAAASTPCRAPLAAPPGSTLTGYIRTGRTSIRI